MIVCNCVFVQKEISSFCLFSTQTPEDQSFLPRGLERDSTLSRVCTLVKTGVCSGQGRETAHSAGGWAFGAHSGARKEVVQGGPYANNLQRTGKQVSM